MAVGGVGADRAGMHDRSGRTTRRWARRPPSAPLGWAGEERRRPRGGPVHPGLLALLEDLALVEDVVVGAIGQPIPDSGRVPVALASSGPGRDDAPALGHPLAEVVDLAAYRAARGR
jgi:hypothetical protein